LSGSSGHIVIDAGSDKIIEHASYVEQRADNAVMHIFSDNVVNEFWAEENNFGSDVSVNGKLEVTSCGMFGSTLAVEATVSAVNYRLNSTTDVTAIEAAMTVIIDRATTITAYATSSASDRLELIDNTEIATVEFEWRDSSDYKTTDLVVFEPRWQQIARLTSQELAVWTEEPSTDSAANVTYPYPGKSVWLDGDAYYRTDLILHDQATDLAENRGSLYESPAYATPTSENLDGNFVIIANPC
jgi:hypothetical protein